ncbi:hypothetical protein [Actinomadura rubrisoli]|uniref:hypothetical protein n=1 Tax=Actinomadura rubrisoli TaxID=2530368 RepID=UPI001A9EE701|nr:hypothetical protein [Actinomadura rubrisoli]
MLERDGIPPVLIDERMGHEDGSVQRRYTHVIAKMREHELTGQWEQSLAARLAMAPGSPVAALDELLRARSLAKEMGRPQGRPIEFPQEAVAVLRARP